MFDLRLTSEQRQIAEAVRDFVSQEVKPVVLSPSHLQPLEPHISLDLLDKASQMGLRTLALSERLGGAGADTLTSCLVLEELAVGDVDLAITLAHTAALGRALFDDLMNPGQRARYLAQFIAQDRFHLAFVGNEPDSEAGWNYYRPGLESKRTITAVPHGSGWVLEGMAHYVPNAQLAALFAVEATTAGMPDASPATFLIPSDAPGLSVRGCEKIERLPGEGGVADLLWYHGLRGDVSFNDCQVPADCVLPARVTAHLRSESPQICAINLGIGRAALEAALEYAKLRVQGGRPIIEHQAIGAILANVAIKLEAARALVWKAAWVEDHPDMLGASGVPLLPARQVAKTFTSEAVHEAALESAECFGAMGVMRDMPLQKYVHDALIFIHSGTSNSVSRFRIAEALAEYRRATTASA